MKKILFIALLLVLSVSCDVKTDKQVISDYDIEKIYELHENYRKYWLQNDSMKVVNLFSEVGALIPPKNPNDFIKGKESIGEWWFTIRIQRRLLGQAMIWKWSVAL